MTAKEVLKRLNEGQKITVLTLGNYSRYIYIGEEKPENRLTEVQYKKYEAMCKNFEDNSHTKWFRGQSYRNYFWL